MIKKLTAALSLICTVFSANALASDSSVYIGADIGHSHIQNLKNVGKINISNTSTSYGVYTGYQFNPYLSVELGYREIGKFNTTLGDLKIDSWDLTLNGRYPIYQHKLYATAKAGLAITKAEILGLNDKNNTAVYGLGLEYDVNKNISISTNWNRYHKVVDEHIDNFSIGMKYRF